MNKTCYNKSYDDHAWHLPAKPHSQLFYTSRKRKIRIIIEHLSNKESAEIATRNQAHLIFTKLNSNPKKSKEPDFFTP